MEIQVSGLEDGWTDPGFDDETWRNGDAQVGFGQEDQSATVTKPGDALTLYLRYPFTPDDPAQHEALVLDLLANDGAVVYLNGTEVHRTKVPTRELDYNTPALAEVASDVNNLA